MKKISAILLMIIIAGFISQAGLKSLSAQETQEGRNAAASDKEAVNVGNKVCPASGDAIDPAVGATYEYKGKIYNFCCSGCIEEFLKDPQKYIKIVEEELQAASKEKSGQEK